MRSGKSFIVRRGVCFPHFFFSVSCFVDVARIDFLEIEFSHEKPHRMTKLGKRELLKTTIVLADKTTSGGVLLPFFSFGGERKEKSGDRFLLELKHFHTREHE
jgi:hypothetical protein